MKPIAPTLEQPTKNAIIEQIANQADVKAFIFDRYRPEEGEDYNLNEELYQEFFIRLYDKIKEDVLIDAYLNERLHLLIITTISNMMKPKDDFYKQFVKPRLIKINNHPFSEDDHNEMVDLVRNRGNELSTKDEFDKLLDYARENLKSNIETLYHWDKELLKKFLNENNNRVQVSNKYGINYRYVSEAMQRNIKNLKDSIEESYEEQDEIIPEVSVITAKIEYPVQRVDEEKASALWIKYKNLPTIKSEDLKEFNKTHNNRYGKKK